MAHIYVFSPSGAVRNQAGFRRALKRLQGLGHEVEVDPSARLSHQRFAGDDATRVAAVTRAAASGAKTLRSKRPALQNRQNAMPATAQFIHSAPGLARLGDSPSNAAAAR